MTTPKKTGKGKKRKVRAAAPKGGMAGVNMAAIYPDGNIWVDVEDPTPAQARRLAKWILAWAESREGKW